MRAGKFCFAMLVAGLAAAGCSSASTYNPYDYGSQGQPPMASAAAAVPAASSAGGYFPAGDNGLPTAGPAAAATPAAGGADNAPLIEDQIVKTGTIRVQVSSVDDAIARATDQIHALGGWLAGSDRSGDSTSEVASVTYRIPVDQFENALAAMRKFGTKVLYEHTDSTAVGGQIVDLKARIENLQASEKAIQSIMNKATTITDVLDVQQRLSDVQGQIEELSGQLTGLTDQATYSTLTVQFEVPYSQPTPTPTPTPSPSPTQVAWSAGDQAGQAAGTLRGVGEAGATALIWIVVLVLPILLVTVVLLVLLGFSARLLDPFRRRLLPFTVAPVAQAAGYGTRPYPGQPVPGQPVGGTEERPKS